MRKVHVTPMFSFGSWSGFTWHIIKTTNMFIGLVYIFPHGFSFLVRRWAHATRLSKSQKRWPARATRLASFASRLFGVVTMYILHNLSPGEIPKFCFFSETQELSIISPKLHGNERKRGGNNGCWDMGIAYREKKLFLLELCADRNQIMFIFAVTNNRFGMPWQKKKKFLQKHYYCSYILLALSHSNWQKINWVQGPASRWYPLGLLRLYSRLVAEGFTLCDSSVRKLNMLERISAPQWGRTDWEYGIGVQGTLHGGGGSRRPWGREYHRHLSVAGKSGLISCSVVLIRESIIRRTCLCGPLSIWALAPSHAVLMASRDGVPNRSVIKSNWRREVSRKWERYKTE